MEVPTMQSKILQEYSQKKQKGNVFSIPWANSDVVLVVEGKEFHVHRWMLSLQSPVFSAMFSGNFKDSSQEKIELKDDKHEAMLPFLKLLYPPNMLKDDGKPSVEINNENILSIVELADKYEAKNILAQCLTSVKHLQPESTMRLLPYAVRHELPVEEILDVIARRISTDKLENFTPELENESLHIKTLVRKCRFQENAIQRAHGVMLYLLRKCVKQKRDLFNEGKTSVACAEHGALEAQDFKKARKCKNCLLIYKRRFIDDLGALWDMDAPFKNTKELVELLELGDDIATSLKE